MLLSEAFLKRTLKVIRNVEKLLEKPSEENLHDLRVESRKLESLFLNLGSLSSNNEYTEYLEKIKKFIKLFGPSRETDVSIEITDGYISYKKSDNKLLLSFSDGLKNSSVKLRKKIFTSRKLVDFLLSKSELEDFVRNKMFPLECGISIDEFCKYLGKSLLKLYDDMILYKDTVVADNKNKRELHKMRLKAKPLRYTLDLVNEIIGLELTEKGKGVKDIVNLAGKIHDYDVLLEKAEEFISDFSVSSNQSAQPDILNEFKEFQDFMRNSRQELYIELKELLKSYSSGTGSVLVSF